MDLEHDTQTVTSVLWSNFLMKGESQFLLNCTLSPFFCLLNGIIQLAFNNA